jgi:autotransporter-associated beta strand protein
LSGANTYSGGTNLNGGTLAVNSDANLGTGPLSFNGGTLDALAAGGGIVSSKAITLNSAGGTFLADAGTASTLSGPITGTGSWTMAGQGTLTLIGVNTYSGGTNLNGGTLAVGSDSNLGTGALSFNGGTLEALAAGGGIVSSKAIALNSAGGTFLADAGTASALSGAITGTGSWTKSGPGTLTLTGANTYSGGTTVSAGTLQLGNGGTAGSITGNVSNNGVLAFDRSDSVTFAGTISGTGSVTQIGTGTTILTGNNTYTGGTTISTGTLQLGNGGTTGTIIGNITDSGTLVFNRSDALTFGGVVSGIGDLVQSGGGTLTLTGTNTYSGGTNLNGGILAVNSDMNLGTGALSFNGGTLEALAAGGGIVSSKAITLNSAGGTFLADAGTASTLSGPLTGAGSWTKNGPGILTLTGTNTYSGGTTVSAGTLQIGNGGTAGSITGNVSDNGVLAFNRSDSVTFAGTISGAGSVTQIGTGTTILTGNNTYTGGTTISTGTLQLGNGGTTGTIIGNVTDNGTLVFNRSDSLTFGGVISGAGSLVKQGAGTLTLPGTNTYTGATTVNAGSLIVDGSIASAQTLVSAGGLLGGHGFLNGSLVNSGIVSPGNSPGTLTVNNNYTQNTSGTLRIEIGGLAPTQHDLLAVNGHVTLGGTLQLVRLGSFNLQPGDQIVFLTAQKGISGAFNTVQNDFVSNTIVQGVVISLADEVVLEGQQGSFAQTPGVAVTPNQLAVAKMLDSAAGDPRAAALFAFLNSQPLGNLPHDLDLIAPTQITSMNATALSLGNVQMFNLEQQLANIRAGSTGFSSAGFAISGGAASFGQGLAGVSGPEGKGGPPVFAPTPSNHWGVFVTGLGEFTNVDSTSNAPGYDVNTGGFTLGVDYRLTPNFALGLTAGYAHTNVGIDSPGGNIDVNAGRIGMYATVFGNGFYLDAAVSGGPSGYTTHRTALQGSANGSTNGGDLDGLIAGGYDWQKGNLTIGPTASFQYGYIAFDGFTETGSLAPLKFPRQNTESERTAVGAKASYEWKVGNITAIPEIRAAWQHEFGTSAYSVVANLASGAGNSFTVNGPPIGRDSLLIGAGATIILNERVSAHLYYDGEFARTNYLSNNVSGGVRISF